MNAPELLQVSEADWTDARRSLPVIRRLAELRRRTRADVLQAAAELGCGPSHAYVLLGRYLADPRLTSLLPRAPGPNSGFSKLDPAVDALIDEMIDSVYLKNQRPKIKDLVDQIRGRCRAMGLPLPGRKAITKRLRARPSRQVASLREGPKAARDRFAPAVGSLEVSWPLSLVQIDHTLVDVIVVDRITRAPIQRPWLT